MAALLRLANIEKSYNITKTQKQVVLKGVTVEFDRGEFVALVGESGCGKSTLINIMGGLDSEYTGSVVVKDAFIRDYTEKQLDDYRKKRVGMVFQDYNLIHHLTLAENIEIAMRMSDIEPKLRHERAMELLRMVGLDQYERKYPSQLSGGQQQRVAIARALANNPSIILADEPTGALDKESQDVILKILAKIVQSGKLVIVVTHSELVSSYCSRVVRIDDGVVVSDVRKTSPKEIPQYEKVIMPKPIRVKDVARLSFQNLMKKKSRTLMVSIGLAIGIAAVVLILNLGLGLTDYVREVYVDNLQSTQLAVSMRDGSAFTDDDLAEILEVDGIARAYPSAILEGVACATGDLETDIDGLSAFYRFYYPAILYGELADEVDEIIVNETMASDLSENGLIGAVGLELSITVDDVTTVYTVTGIYEDGSDGTDESDALIVADALAAMVDLAVDANVLYLTMTDVTTISVAKDDLAELGYSVRQAENEANFLLEYIEMGTQILTGVGAISMVVAAIMIFIVLYISIVERTKEIGILRAIGARKRDIRTMFICEAGFIGLGGGAMAVVFALAVTVATNVITGISLQTALIGYGVENYLLGLALSFAVSILAGIAPAVKAADLDPVVALRFE